MNTFFRIAVYLSVAMIAFNLIIGFVGSLSTMNGQPLFGVADHIGTSDSITEGNVLAELTMLDDPNMSSLWLGVVGTTFLGAVALAGIIRSPVPIGIHIFSAVFWTAYIRSNAILSTGDWLPGAFLSIFFILMIFLFIAALVGMLTGGG